MRFKYTPAAATNIAKTFARERARLKAEADKKKAEAQAHEVVPLRKGAGK